MLLANREQVASPVLVRIDDAAAPVIRIDRPLSIVGSKLHSHVRIVSRAVSGSHALLLNAGNHVFVRDLMSRTHLFLNDQEVTEARLKYGDVLRVGEMQFRYFDVNVVRKSLPRVLPAAGTLHPQDGGEAIRLDKPLFVVGRRLGADLRLNHRAVSKAHAVIYVEGHGRTIRDLGSRHGTFVNGTAVRSTPLVDGAVVQIGSTSFRYHAATDDAIDEQDELLAQVVSPESPLRPDESSEPQRDVACATGTNPAMESSSSAPEPASAPAGDPQSRSWGNDDASGVKGLELIDAGFQADVDVHAWHSSAEGDGDGVSSDHDSIEAHPAASPDELAENLGDLVAWGVVSPLMDPITDVSHRPAKPADELPPNETACSTTSTAAFPEIPPLGPARPPATPEVDNRCSDRSNVEHPCDENTDSNVSFVTDTIGVDESSPSVAQSTDQSPAPEANGDPSRSAPDPVGLSAPVELPMQPSAETQPVEADRGDARGDAPPAAGSELTDPDPLSAILGDQVLTIYKAAGNPTVQPLAGTAVPSRIRSVLITSVVALGLIAAIACGAWVYFHRM